MILRVRRNEKTATTWYTVSVKYISMVRRMPRAYKIHPLVGQRRVVHCIIVLHQEYYIHVYEACTSDHATRTARARASVSRQPQHLLRKL